MHLKIDPEIFKNYPDFKAGIIIIRNFDNSRRNSNLVSLLRGICAQRGREYAGKDLSDEPKVRTWFSTYGKFGINPKKNSPSVAALLKRVQKGKEIPHINPLVDLYNYFSLKYLLPIGSEDLDWLCGDLRLTFTKGGEPFRPLGSIDIEQAIEGEVAYMDDGGITCRYWNHRECERTKLSSKTNNAIIIIEDMSKMHMDEFGAVLKEVQNAIIKYIGGQIEPYIINEENPGIDLGVEGRKHVDDSKIPKQEMAHFKKLKEQSKGPKQEPETPPLEVSDIELLKKKIGLLLKDALKKSFPPIGDISIKIDYPDSEDHGDYACNIALQISKELKMPPQQIAEKIISNISKDELIEKIEIAGPGFINFFLSKKALNQELEDVLDQKDDYGKLSAGSGKTVIVEYSSPNIAKPLGVHHLPTTIIGQTIYNILTMAGFKTLSINHLGDWGTQFGKLTYAYKKWGDKKIVEKNPIQELLKLYVHFHEEAEKDPSLEDEARREFKIFEEGDKENREIWQWFVDVSMIDIQKAYDHLGGIHFDHIQGESFYENRMQEIIDYGKEKDIFVKGEEGAYIAEYEDPNIAPFVVLKKDGATLYSTRDFAALKYRIEEFKPLKILYIVDIAQTLHFKQLFLAAERFPWYHHEGEHISFGRMSMKDKKMSTRKGNVILLDDVLDEATERAKKIIQEKSPHLKDKDKLAEIIGIGAIKYNILSQNRTTNIVFDWDKMLSLEGNSGPYMQYTYARAKSILRKSSTTEEGTTVTDPEIAEKRIASLIRLFPKFKEAIISAAIEYKPNIISNYLYKLAQEFNSFYNSVPVLKPDSPEKKAHRLKLVEATSQILKNGLALLGVEVVEEM